MQSIGALFRRLLLATLLLVTCTDVVESQAHRRSSRPDYCDEQSSQSSLLWRIDTTPPSFFFGTIHVPYDRVWDHIPENVKRAFQLADAVFFELDLTEPATVSALTKCQLLPRGARLEQLLPSDIYRRLQNHLNYIRRQMPLWLSDDQRGRGMYADYLFNAITGNWRQKRPVWVMLMVNSLTEGDVRSRGVPVLDLYLAMEAERRNKRTGAVEKVEEQCLPLNRLERAQVVFALNRTLIQQERIRAGQPPAAFTTEDLIQHYNCGDLDEAIFRRDSSQIPPSVLQVAPLQPTLSTSTSSPASSGDTSSKAGPGAAFNIGTDTDSDADTAQTIDRYFRHELIYNRNRRMGERILELLWAHPHTSFFFAFGAGHFLGNFTVLEVLRQAGYKVTRVGPRERIRRFNRRKNPDEKELDFAGFPPAFNPAGRPTHSGDSSDIFTSDDHAVFEAAQATASSRKKYLDNFSDLWVRIDDPAKRRSDADSGDSDDVQTAEDSVKLWLGVPAGRTAGSGTEPLAPSASLLAALLLLVVALSPPRTIAYKTGDRWQKSS